MFVKRTQVKIIDLFTRPGLGIIWLWLDSRQPQRGDTHTMTSSSSIKASTTRYVWWDNRASIQKIMWSTYHSHQFISPSFYHSHHMPSHKLASYSELSNFHQILPIATGLYSASFSSVCLRFSDSSSLSTFDVYSLITCKTKSDVLDIKFYTSSDLNKVRHGKVHDVVFPRQFQDHVGMQQVVALK